MKTQFIVGDKVRILSNTPDSLNPLGSIGTISEVNRRDGDFRVIVEGYTDDNMTNWQNMNEIELVPDYMHLIKRKSEVDSTIDIDDYSKGVIDGISWQKERIKSIKPIDRKDLVLGKEYFLDAELITMGTFIAIDIRRDTISFEVKYNNANYTRELNGYVEFYSKGIPFFEIEPTTKSPANTTIKMTYTKIEAENLIEGNIYYTDDIGRNKVIYEGRMKKNKDRFLLNPIGKTDYFLYDESHYKGKYVGRYSLGIDGHYYEEDQVKEVK